MHTLLDPMALLQIVGLYGVPLIIFAETGLFFGFFFPGDSLLFAAGILASQGIFAVEMLLLLTTVAAIVGDTVGYWFGHRVGRRLFQKEDSLLFKRRYLEKTEAFYAKYGPKTIILARFVPIVRTFAPILAGTAQMQYRKFFLYNVFGGIIWTSVNILAGYFLGATVPGIERHLPWIIAAIVAFSLIPIFIEIFLRRKK